MLLMQSIRLRLARSRLWSVMRRWLWRARASCACLCPRPFAIDLLAVITLGRVFLWSLGLRRDECLTGSLSRRMTFIYELLVFIPPRATDPDLRQSTSVHPRISPSSDGAHKTSALALSLDRAF